MKKLLNSLYILDETAYLSLDGENIVCKFDEKPPMRVPLVNLEDIYVFGYSGCSPALMGKCAQEGVALNFFTPNGLLLAHIRGKTKGNIYLRAEQFRMVCRSATYPCSEYCCSQALQYLLCAEKKP